MQHALECGVEFTKATGQAFGLALDFREGSSWFRKGLRDRRKEAQAGRDRALAQIRPRLDDRGSAEKGRGSSCRRRRRGTGSASQKIVKETHLIVDLRSSFYRAAPILRNEPNSLTAHGSSAECLALTTWAAGLVACVSRTKRVPAALAIVPRQTSRSCKRHHSMGL